MPSRPFLSGAGSSASGLVGSVLSGPALTRAVERAVAVRDEVRHRRRVRAVASILDELDAVHTTGQPLHPRRVVRNTTDVVVVMVDHPANRRVIKVALSETAAYGLADHVRAVRALRSAGASAPDSAAALVLLPEVLETGKTVGQNYLIESACRGIGPLVADHATLAAAADALTALQRPTRKSGLVGDALLISLIEDPLLLLRSDDRLAPHVESIAKLGNMLDAALRSRHAVTARTHGDFWLGNVLVEQGREMARVAGIIDWEDSIATGIPDVDLAHLWLSTQPDGIALATIRSFGAERLADVTGPWIGTPPNPDLSGEAIVLLAWLGHVSAGLDRSSKFGLGRMWLDETVRPVLEAIDQL